MQDDAHGRIAGLEDRPAGMLAQTRNGLAVVDPHAEIRLQRPEAEIEQDSVAVLAAQRLCIGTKLGEHAAAVHRAISLRQAKRDALIPVGLVDALGRKRPHLAIEPQRNAAASGHRGERIGGNADLRRLVRVAREFGNGPERPEAPLRAGIGNFAAQQRDVTCGLSHGRRARQLAKYMKPRSPGIGPERIPSQSPRASRPGARPDRHRASERHAGLHEIGAAG